MIVELGEHWDHSDAVYRKKNIGAGMIVELIGGTDRGAIIKIWTKPDDWWLGHFERFPKNSPLTEDKQWMLLDTIHFMHWDNADAEYIDIKNQKDGVNLAWRNR